MSETQVLEAITERMNQASRPHLLATPRDISEAIRQSQRDIPVLLKIVRCQEAQLRAAKARPATEVIPVQEQP